jgi:hypothetical protein
MRARIAAALATVALASSFAASPGCSGSNGAHPPEGPSCGDTTTDPNNCGTCGHGCRGGACQSGACVTLPPGVLASGQRTPASVVVDATDVFWVNRGTRSGTDGTYSGAQIVKCAKNGCNNAPTVLATGSWTQITNLAIDHGYVYWGADEQIFKCSTNGCNGRPTVLWSGADGVGELALDDASLYFDMADSDEVIACSVDACDAGEALMVYTDASPRPYGTLSNPTAIAVDDDNLYEVAPSISGVVLSCAIVTCSDSVRLLASGTGNVTMFAPLLAVDATNIYFVAVAAASSFGPDRGTRVPGGSGGTNGNESGSARATISFVGKTSMNVAPTTLLDGQSLPSAIAVDGTALYVAEWGDENDAGTRSSGAGRILTCAVPTCNDRPALVQDYVNYPQGIAIDDAHVYWTDFGSGTDPSGSTDGRVMVRAR